MRRGLLTIHAADFVHVHGLVNADVFIWCSACWAAVMSYASCAAIQTVLGGPCFRVAHDGLDGHLFTPMQLQFCPRGVVFP